MVLFLHIFPSCTVKCTRNEDCSLTEVCIEGGCHHPCDVHNPCAQNAICVNTNHGTDCSCAEGYQGNGYVGCQPGKKQRTSRIIYDWSNRLVNGPCKLRTLIISTTKYSLANVSCLAVPIFIRFTYNRTYFKPPL